MQNKFFVIGVSFLITAFFAMTNREKNLRTKVLRLLKNLENDNDMWIVANESKNARLCPYEYCIKNNADYEDALQYFCALENGYVSINTNDKGFPNLDTLLRSTKE